MVKRFTSHTLMALAEASIIALLVVGLIAGTALAGKGPGKPSGGGGGSLSMVPMDGATAAHFGARVTFTISTSATSPYVHLRCWQGGTLVAEGRQGFFARALGNPWFTLGPTPAWQGGAADCTADLEVSGRRGGWSVQGSTSFSVAD